MGQGDFNRNKTHCPQGHEYTPENTIWTKDKKRRSCRKCYLASHRRLNVTKHGISVEKRDELLAQQGGKCKICPTVLTEDMQKCIDHDHRCCPGLYSCGKCIRGILCVDCNVAIGRFKDNIEILQLAIVYLQAYQDKDN
jgi:Recombination endonuclease VII